MDTADNRNYGLPRRGGTKGCSTAKDRTGTSFDNLTFYEGKRSRRKRDWPAKPSIPFPRPKSRGEGSPLFLLSSPSPCYKQPITTIEILSAEYSYGCFIVFFSFISDRPIIYFLLSTILLKVFFRAGRIFLMHKHSLGQSFITSSRDFNRDQSRVCFSC